MLRRTLCARTFIRRTAMSSFDNLRSTRSASERERCKLDDVFTVERGPQTDPSWDVGLPRRCLWAREALPILFRWCEISTFCPTRSRAWRRIPVWLSRRLHFKWVSDGIAALEGGIARNAVFTGSAAPSRPNLLPSIPAREMLMSSAKLVVGLQTPCFQCSFR